MPGLVDQGFAQWLKDESLLTSAATGGVAVGLLPSAIESEVISALATKAAADSEAARQIAILGGPLALDRHVVKGQRRDLVGKCITLTHDLLGYSAGEPVFVVSADERDDNLTILEVVRSLAFPYGEYALAFNFSGSVYAVASATNFSTYNLALRFAAGEYWA